MVQIIFGTVLPWLLLAVGCWLGYQLMRQNGRILLRLQALQGQLAQLQGQRLAQPQGALAAQPAPPSGLPLGSPAPDFELPDLAGGRRSLAQFRGRNLLLIFFNPQCGFCTKMAPALAALPSDGGEGRPVPLVVTTGAAEGNRRLVDEHGLRCPVLLQQQMEVASHYLTGGTPTGYLIDEQGNIASALAMGADALLALAAPSAARSTALANGAAGGAHAPNVHKGKVDRGLAASRINRSGLQAGTPAPEFRLPRLGGGELSLEDYRGSQLLLVFSDPQCGPCDELAPHLEQFHRERTEFKVLMLSRRDAESNRQKVATLGLTFPVVLQKEWEISLRYGMFGTPIGYLIDEQGIIAADVAAGVQPILDLVSDNGSPANEQAKAAPVQKATR
jgi:peroxiredoxin